MYRLLNENELSRKCTNRIFLYLDQSVGVVIVWVSVVVVVVVVVVVSFVSPYEGVYGASGRVIVVGIVGVIIWVIVWCASW